MTPLHLQLLDTEKGFPVAMSGFFFGGKAREATHSMEEGEFRGLLGGDSIFKSFSKRTKGGGGGGGVFLRRERGGRWRGHNILIIPLPSVYCFKKGGGGNPHRWLGEHGLCLSLPVQRKRGGKRAVAGKSSINFSRQRKRKGSVNSERQAVSRWSEREGSAIWLFSGKKEGGGGEGRRKVIAAGPYAFLPSHNL